MKLKTGIISRKKKGFTLLEVIVSLAVLTMGLGAVIKVATNQSSQVAYIKNKTIALWVANNKANEVQLESWPRIGVSEGSESMAHQEWRWKLTVSKTADKDLRRLDIEVSQDNEKGEPLVRFIAFTGNSAGRNKTQ